MSRLFKVADGILDSAASEYYEENTKDIKAVQLYGDSIDIILNNDEAKLVLNICNSWMDKEIFGEQREWYDDVVEPLRG